jgi:hypothetical protein
MLVNGFEESEELRVMQALKGRWELGENESWHFTKLVREMEGNKQCEEWLKNLSTNWAILNKLYIKTYNEILPIDALAYSGKKLYHYLVLNEEGDFYIDGDKWHTTTHIQIDNPLHMLQRRELLLQKSLQSIGYKIPIESYIVFINPHFNLYRVPVNQQLILPTQLNSYIKKLNQFTPNLTENHLLMINEILSLQTKPPFSNLVPQYRYKDIKKRILCCNCGSFQLIQINVCTFGCKDCGHSVGVEQAILKGISDFRILFPDIKLTTSIIFEWCGQVVSKKVIRKILTRNFKLVECGRSSYYI